MPAPPYEKLSTVARFISENANELLAAAIWAGTIFLFTYNPSRKAPTKGKPR